MKYWDALSSLDSIDMGEWKNCVIWNIQNVQNRPKMSTNVLVQNCFESHIMNLTLFSKWCATQGMGGM